MIDRKVFVRFVHHTCYSCAREVYGHTPPNEGYAAAVGQLLFGTIAHESDAFRATRQHKFSWASDKGAWGLAQCEIGSVTDSLKYLKARPDVAKRVAVWLNSDEDATLDVLLNMTPQQVIRLLPMSDRLAILFCRLHYMRVPGAVPRDTAGQDAYYKKFYNTIYGAAAPGDFTAALHRAMVLVEG